jgi:hypothetical protein
VNTLAASRPHSGQDALLHREVPCQAIEVAQHQAVDQMLLDGVQRLVQADPAVHAIAATDALV